jgi:membrane-bound lytic murein transglycosylase D
LKQTAWIFLHRSARLLPAALLMMLVGCASLDPDAAKAPAAAPAANPLVASPPVVGLPVASALPRAAAAVNTPSPANLTQAQYDDVWSRMRAGFSMPELNTPLVAEKERYYLAHRESLQRMFTRGGRYLYFIVEEVERRGMPAELALLPFVESAMNPVAVSSAQAAGLWQFIPSTGKQYNLSQNWWVDNRRDVVQSTGAALDYLQKIYEMNERDWFLALASYNWGENAVARAVKNNRARGLPVDYLSLSMPNETRNYVPKLIALKHIIQNAKALGIVLPNVPNRPYFATIEKTRPIDLKLAAQFAGMNVEDFVAINPAHNRPVIAASRNNQIRIPADRVDSFLSAVEIHNLNDKPLASWQPYTLKPGETLDDVARQSGVSSTELLRANGLKPGGRMLPGTQLIVPQAAVKDQNQIESFLGPRVYEQITITASYHQVGRRESMASVASRYGVSVAQLSAWNGGAKSARAGTRLVVRPASNQTVLTTVGGARQVVARSENTPSLPAAPETIDPPPSVAKAQVSRASKAGGSSAKSGSASAKNSQRSSGPVAKAAPTPRTASASNTVRTVYKTPPKPAPAKAPTKVART